MQPVPKKLGEMLVESGLITASQLQDALRHQRIAGGRMGSNLVALGFISEDVLMDFLAQKTGVPRLDLKNIDIPAAILRRIPQRLADQLNVLPISLKEPKSLVLAMADPSDLNAIDSARFASGMNIEPVVASHSALRTVILEQYRKLAEPEVKTIEVGAAPNFDEALPVSFDLAPPAMDSKPTITIQQSHQPRNYAADPFFDVMAEPAIPSNPFSFFEPDAPKATVADPRSTQVADSQIIHQRPGSTSATRRLESFETRTLLMGLIRLLQRRSVIGQDELQRLITNLIESGELEERGRPGSDYR